MPHRVDVNTVGEFIADNPRGLPLRLCRLVRCPPPVPKPVDAPKDKEKKASPESPQSAYMEFVDGFTFVPVVGAYVLGIPAPGGFNAALDPARSFRTAEDGLVVAPSGGGDRGATARFEPRTSLWVYWTFSAARSAKVARDARADPLGAISRYGFSRAVLDPLLSVADGPDADVLRLDQRTGRMLRAALWSSTSGLVTGKVLEACLFRNVTLGFETPYLLARSPALEALFLAELLQHNALSLKQSSVARFEKFATALSILETTESGGHVKALDDENPRDFYRNEYIRYANECAAVSAITEDDFAAAIHLRTLNHERWINDVRKIEAHGIRHPCTYPGDDHLRWEKNRFIGVTQSTIVKYFQFYRYGFGLPRHAYWQRWQKASDTARASYNVVQGIVIRLLTRRAPYSRFLDGLADHAGGPEAARQLHDRYLDAALNSSHLFWNDLEKEPELKRASDALKDLGIAGDKIGAWFEKHFGSFEQVAKWNEALEGNKPRIQNFFKRLTDLNKRLGGRTVPRKFKEIRIKADFASKLLTIETSEGRLQGTFRFVEEVEEVVVMNKVPTKRTMNRRKKVYRDVPRTVKRTRFTILEREYTHWPVWLGLAGSVLQLAAAIQEFSEKIHTETTLMVVELGQGVLSVVGSGTSAALSVQHLWAQGKGGARVLPPMRILSKAATPALILELVLNFREGYLLVFDDTGEAAIMRSQGRSAEANLFQVKGGILMVTTAGAATHFGIAVFGAEALGAEAVVSILGPWGIAAGITVLIVDVSRWLAFGPGTIMDEFAKDFEKSSIEEFRGGDNGETVRILQRFNSTASQLVDCLP